MKRAGEAPLRSSAVLKAELEARERNVAYRLAALKEEVTAPFGGLRGGSRSLMSTTSVGPERRWVIAGVVGATAGILLGLRARAKRRRRQPDAGFEFVQARLATFLEEAAARVANGRSAEDALNDLFRTVPVVYADRHLSADALEPQPGLAKTLMKSAFGFGLKAGLDLLTQRLTGHEETFASLSEENA